MNMKSKLSSTKSTDYLTSTRLGEVSRFFFAPINTGLATNGSPSSKLIDFYKERSSSRIGINIIGNVAIGEEFQTNKNTLVIRSDDSLWKTLFCEIQSRGSLPGVQLACNINKYVPQKAWKNSNPQNYIEMIRNEIKSLDPLTINHIIDQFVLGAEIAISLGAKHLQIHAAHGYFLSLISSNIFNCRTDKFGEDKSLVIKDIVKRIRNFGTDFLLDVRLSLFELEMNSSKELEYKRDIVDTLSQIGPDIISFSNGIYNIDKNMIYPLPTEKNEFLLHGKSFSEYYQDILFNVPSPEVSFGELLNGTPNNLTFSVGRNLICDPEFIDKSLSGNKTLVKPCNYCGRCHYYSRGYKNIIESIHGEDKR